MASNQTLQSFKRNVSSLNKRLDTYKDIISKNDLVLMKSMNNQMVTLFNEVLDSLEKKVDAK
jgi:hypothetical protein